MKTRICFGLWLMCFTLGSSFGQSPITIYTPKNSSLTAYSNMPYMSNEVKDAFSSELAINYPNATEVGYRSATYSYNCHGYAWHRAEGGSEVWLGYYYVTDEDVYWEDGSYILTTEPYASKISYYNGNHSAIQTATQGVYVSKWGAGCLVQHANNYGPAIYQMNYRKYYKLNPGITGSTSALCYNQERTFYSDVSIPGSTYTWTKNYLLDYVSGAGTTGYTAKGYYGNGNGWLRLQVTTPSGEVATSPYKYVWVGVPDIPTTYPSGNPPHQMMVDELGYIQVTSAPGASTDFYYWVVSGSIEKTSPYDPAQACGILAVSQGNGYFSVKSENACGLSNSANGEVYVSDYWKMLVVPNPTSSSVRISIDKDITSMSDFPWELEIYNNQNSLRFKRTSIKETFIDLNTSSWIKGIYYVRIKLKDRTLGGKLIVN